MRNPLKRQPSADPKPTLRERAASLKATAGRVMSGAKPDAPATSAALDARAFALEQAALIDLSALSIMQLGALFDRFDAASNAWSAELHLPYADERMGAFRLNTAAGDVLEREQERVAAIRDRIAAEIDRRQPTGPQDADAQLETTIRYELMCNGDLRDPAIRARIEAAWGDAPAHDAPAESVGPVGNLHAIGREFDAAHEAWRKAVETNREPNQRFTAFLEAAKARGGPSRVDIQAAYALPGVEEAGNVEDRAFEVAGELSLAALKLPARTLADLAVQARAVIPHVWATGSYENDGGPEADENIDKEAVRSLIESCCAAAGVDWRGALVSEASAAEPADAGFSERRDPLGDLLAGIDLPAMPMRTLSALHDHIETLNNVSYGLVAQPCSLNRDHMPNEAGAVMYRLIEELLQRASNACLSEAKRRASATDDDRDIRLAMMARHTIENDDPNEIRALAHDLLAMAKV